MKEITTIVIVAIGMAVIITFMIGYSKKVDTLIENCTPNHVLQICE
tara:strand:- start:608 stop:745 length:138 start_codon:yes stop_codon:yes gene_type:complete